MQVQLLFWQIVNLDPADQPGALGRGQQTATALTTFFQ